MHIKLIGDPPHGSGALEEARVAAPYLAKCVSKSLDDERRAARLHRYEVAQGFQPQRLQLQARVEAELLAGGQHEWAVSRPRCGGRRTRRAGRSRRRCGVRDLLPPLEAVNHPKSLQTRDWVPTSGQCLSSA